MTKEEFKRKWESDETVAWNDIAKCAIDWKVCRDPFTKKMVWLRYQVLLAAKVKGAEEYHPEKLRKNDMPFDYQTFKEITEYKDWTRIGYNIFIGVAILVAILLGHELDAYWFTFLIIVGPIILIKYLFKSLWS